jgi:hypothetical protein
VVLESGDNQAEIPNVFQILLFVSFVTNFDRNFWNLYVNEQFVLLCSFLSETNIKLINNNKKKFWEELIYLKYMNLI